VSEQVQVPATGNAAPPHWLCESTKSIVLVCNCTAMYKANAQEDYTILMQWRGVVSHLAHLPYQQSPEEVRIACGTDAYNVPVTYVVLPGADDINPQDAVS